MASRVTTSSSGCLRELRSPKIIDIDVLLVPGLGTREADRWKPFASSEWLSDVAQCKSRRARILTYDYTSFTDDSEISFQHLLEQGDNLVNTLLNSQYRASEDARPLVVVAHSIGGLILKQALCIASESSFRYGSVLSSIAGLIFLGTPHLAPSGIDLVTSLLTILDSTTRTKGRFVLPDEHLATEGAILTLLAERFERIQLQAPILTVVESKKTKVQNRILKSKSLILADKSLCTLHTQFETIMTLPLQHMSLCDLDLGDRLTRDGLRRFAREALDTADHVVLPNLEALDFKYATTSTYSPMESEHPKMLGAESSENTRLSTGNAAAGSSDMGFEMIPQVADEPPPEMKPINLPCIMLETKSKSDQTEGSESGLRQFALCGLGGIGKTEIAIEFALQNQDHFDAIFWVLADEVAKLDDCFLNMSVKLGLETAEEAKNQVVSRSLVKGWLANPYKGGTNSLDEVGSTASGDLAAKWLLIFDNADDPKLLGDYWPEGGGGSILITSRDPLAKRLFSPRSSGIDLGPLRDTDGGNLLLRLTDEEGHEESQEEIATKIAKQLGGLPLAIAQMAGIIRRQDLDLEEFLSMYEEREDRAELYGMRYDTTAKSYRYSIATVWAFEKLSFEAQQILKIIFFMDPDVIPEAILSDAAALIIVHPPLTKLRFSEARSDLLQSSLVKRDRKKDGISEYYLSVHRLVQESVGSKLTKDEMALMFNVLVTVLWKAWPSAILAPTNSSSLFPSQDQTDRRYELSRYPLCAALYPHVLRLKQILPLLENLSDETKVRFSALLNDATWYQFERGRLRDIDGFWNAAQSMCESIPGRDSEVVLANIHFARGQMCSLTNQVEESKRHREAFYAAELALCQGNGTDFVSSRLRVATGEMGISYTAVGELDNAIDMYNREQEIRRKIGITYFVAGPTNHALALMLQGNLSDAEEVLKDCEQMWKATGSVISIRTGRVFHAYGVLRDLQGRHDEAYHCHRQALNSYVKSTGRQSYRTAQSSHAVAEHLVRLKQFEEAIQTINAALQTWSYNPDCFKPEIAAATWLKATALELAGKSQKAKLAFKVAMRLRSEVAPDDQRQASELKLVDFTRLIPFNY